VALGRGTFFLLFLLTFASVADAQHERVAVRFSVRAEWPGRTATFGGATCLFLGAEGPHDFTGRVNADGSGRVRLERGRIYNVVLSRVVIGVGARWAKIRAKQMSISPTQFTVPAIGPIPEPTFRIAYPEGPHELLIRVQTKTGVPIAGTRLLLTWGSGRNALPYGVYASNVAGEVRLTRVPPGLTSAVIVAPGPFAVASERTVGDGLEMLVGPTKRAERTLLMESAGVLKVVVDRRGLAEAPPVSIFTVAGKLVAGPRVRPYVDGEAALYRFDSLRPGRYRVVATLPGKDSMFVEARVRAGFVTPVRLSRAPGGRRDYRLYLRWERVPEEVTFARFFLTSLDHRAYPTTAFEGRRGLAIESTNGAALRDGTYLLRYPKLRLARVLGLDARSNFAIDFTPPRPGFLERGHRTVTVRLRRNGTPIDNYFVGLAGERRKSWMRYAATENGAAIFEHVPAGWYRLRLVDGVLGVRHGLGNKNPPKVSVWRDDVTVDVDLSAR